MAKLAEEKGGWYTIQNKGLPLKATKVKHTFYHARAAQSILTFSPSPTHPSYPWAFGAFKHESKYITQVFVHDNCLYTMIGNIQLLHFVDKFN